MIKILVLSISILVLSAFNAVGQVCDFARTDFKKADSVAELYGGHSLKNLKNLASKLTAPLATEQEKFRSIYKWVCNNIEYDYALFIQNKKKKEKLKTQTELEAWNKQFSIAVFKNLLTKQKTICTGYAYLVRELATHAGLRCVLVDGYGRTTQSNIRGIGNVNHSWNAIQINKKWYLCDATWSSGAYNAELSSYIKKYDDSYFLPSPSLFIRNHYPLDSTWILLEAKPTLHEFLNRPLIYANLFAYKIDQLVPATFDVTTTKGTIVSFRFKASSSKPIKNVELFSKGSSKADFVYPQLNTDTSMVYCIEQIFKTKGTHIVHILLDYNFAITYTVKVN